MKSDQRLYFFWKIGKKVFQLRRERADCIFQYELFLQYRYGITDSFSRTNLYLMELFYLFFPIFYQDLFKLSWDHYVQLIKIFNYDERMFYFRLSLFGNFNSFELAEGIFNHYYDRV